MAEDLIERYLTDIAEVYGTWAGAPETSFYSALENLLSGLGRTLSPRVRCVIHTANRGAGLPDGGMFPLYIRISGRSLIEKAHLDPNLGNKATAYLNSMGVTAEDLFFHTLAVLHAPRYRTENPALRQDWPRVPLPDSRAVLQKSAALGRGDAGAWRLQRQYPRRTQADRGL